MKPLNHLGALALAVALTACQADGTSPDDALDRTLDRDLALQTADQAAEDIELMGAPGGSLGFGLAAAPGDDFHAPFRCGTHDRGHLTVVRTCTFEDATGATQPGYDPVTTESASIHVEVSGSVSRDSWSAEVERVRDLIVTGLAGQETTRTWNGTGSGSASRERHSDRGNREYRTEGEFTIADVVVPVPRRDDGWPLSGSITWQVTVTIVGGPHDGATRTRTVTITFNGTGHVPITVNGRTFTFDLEHRRIEREDDD